jgi:hypothetical protein
MEDGRTTRDLSEISRDMYGDEKKYAQNRFDLEKSIKAISDPLEFSATVASNKHMQLLMKTLSLTEVEMKEMNVERTKSTIFDRFKDMLSRLFSSFKGVIFTDEFGNKVDGRSMVELSLLNNIATVSNLFDNRIALRNSAEKTRAEGSRMNYMSSGEVGNIELGSTVREYLNKAAPEVRAGIREMPNRGYIKFNCN